MRKLERRLARIYTAPSSAGAFGGRERLYNEARKAGLKYIKRTQVTRFFKSQDTYTLHKPVRKRFTHNPIVANDIDHQWEADLVDMSRFAKQNDGNRFLLTVIDVLSKYAWAVPLKSKSAKETLLAFETLFKIAHPRLPKRLHTDKGKEFLNGQVQALLKKKNIHHFSSQSDYKAAIVERFNRTLKERMWRYFTFKNTKRYLNILSALLKGYNHSVHRSIKMAPTDVQSKHVPEIWRRLYPSYVTQPRLNASSIKQGEHVRLVKSKTAFRKGYLPGWTDETFKVSSIVKHPRRVIYKLKDTMDEPILGSFYTQELQSVNAPRKNKLYKIEKILKTRTLPTGQKQNFIKWQGFPTKFNSWINQTAIRRYE